MGSDLNNSLRSSKGRPNNNVPALSDAPPAMPPRSGGAVKGGMFMAASSVAMRFASLLAQLVLGRILLPEDFGLYAIAVAITAIAGAVRSALRPILVDVLAQGRSIDHIHRRSMAGITALSVVAIALSPQIASAYDSPDLIPLLPLMFAMMPLQLLPAFGLARVNEAENYSQLGRLLTLGVVAQQAAIVVCALSGLGVYSFAIGTLIGSTIEVLIVRRAAGPNPRLFARHDGPVAPFPQSDRTALRWLPVTALALVAATNGDYPTIGALTTKTVLGLYFFAYQLTAALAQPFQLAVSSVLVPTFAKLTEPQQVKDGFLRTVRTITVLASLPFGVFAVTVAPFAHLAWPNYDAAVLPIALFALFMPLRLVHPACLSILQGRGQWRSHALMMWLAGGVVIVAAALGAMTDDVVRLTVYVLVGHTAVTLITALRIARLTSSGYWTTVRSILEPWALSMLGVGAAVLTSSLDSVSWSAMVVRLVIYVVIAAPLILWRFRSDLRLLIAAFR